MHRRQRYAMYTERAIALDSLLAISRGDMRALASAGLTAATAVPRAVTFTLKPALLADTLFAVKHHDRMAQALKAETWPGALTRMPRAPRPVDIVDEWTHMLSTVFIASFDRAIVLHYRTVAIRRMAGLALAIRLYELDHGERPTELSALLPDYIDALPIDPFGDGERTFGYLPDALWPRIYTVGPNGTDDAGEIGFHPSGGVHWDHLDPPFFLDGAGPQTEEELSKTRELRQRAADDDR
jgi:hypothetical protein